MPQTHIQIFNFSLRLNGVGLNFDVHFVNPLSISLRATDFFVINRTDAIPSSEVLKF